MIEHVVYTHPDAPLAAKLLLAGEADFKSGRARVRVRRAKARATFVIEAKDETALRAAKKSVHTLLAVHEACRL